MATLTASQKEAMRKLFEDNSLVKEDVFDHKHYVIIKRTGIEKIQNNNGIKISYEVASSDRYHCIVKVIGVQKNIRVETLASASAENCQNKHYAEMAEKRGMSRVVLKICNLYEHGIFGEDENLEHD